MNLADSLMHPFCLLMLKLLLIGALFEFDFTATDQRTAFMHGREREQLPAQNMFHDIAMPHFSSSSLFNRSHS